MPGKSNEVGRQLAELRRSGAAGIHGNQSKDRANTERAAVEQAIVDDDPAEPVSGEWDSPGTSPEYMDDEEF